MRPREASRHPGHAGGGDERGAVEGGDRRDQADGDDARQEARGHDPYEVVASAQLASEQVRNADGSHAADEVDEAERQHRPVRDVCSDRGFDQRQARDIQEWRIVGGVDGRIAERPRA
jgi:hypothetical protein